MQLAPKCELTLTQDYGIAFYNFMETPLLIRFAFRYLIFLIVY